MNTKKHTQVMNEFDDDFGLENLLSKFSSKWYWFLISIIVCVSIAWYVSMVQTPQYLIEAKVMINDSKKGASTGENAMISDAINGSGSAVENEAEVLRTRYLMESVVRDMSLNITYFISDTFRDKELYISPFKVDVVEEQDSTVAADFKIKFLSKDKIELSNEDLGTVYTTYSKPIHVPNLGVIQILRTKDSPKADTQYSFNVCSIDQKVEALVAQTEVLVPNQTSSVVDITFNYPVPKKGEQILSRLIDTYVQTNLNKRNRLADSSYAFIQTRLSYLGGELGNLEQNIQGFKQKNQITEMTQQSSLLISNNSQFVNNLAEVETQLSVLTSLQEYLEKNASGTSVVPSTLVVSDPLFRSLVDRYNNLLLEREKRLLSVTETSTVIQNLNKQIASTRSDMLASLSSSKNSLNITRDNLLNRIKSSEVQAQGVPAKERNYLDLARQQKIKEELFIYLMQKGEETAISKTYNTPNSSNIDPPKSGMMPISPKRNIYYVIGVILGLIIPACLIYLKYLINTKIDSKEDITKRTSVPIIGEIGHNNDRDPLVVSNKMRSPISEQFRALRTNITFRLDQPSEKIILFTSSMAGEGKSFASLNLANVLAISGKKVLLMELDLRKPNLSEKLGISHNFGFTNFITDTDLKPRDVIQHLDLNENLFIISSGILPPNPSEMLIDPRATHLIEELRYLFDYIIIDAPPIGIVTDAELLSHYADLCVFMVRQNFTKKSQLSIVEDIYRNNRMKRTGILVNDIKTDTGSGYSNGYASNYGTYGSNGSSSKKSNSVFKMSK